ncbi:MAG: M48 family metalloprotease [Acidobacteriota bacterium]
MLRCRTGHFVALVLALGSLAQPSLAIPSEDPASIAEARPTDPEPAAIEPIEITEVRLYRQSAQAAQAALAYYGRVDDPEAERRLRTIGYRVAERSDDRRFPFSFYLIDMPVPNAFALPGGQIFVTRGMFDLGLDDDMLANLLGHEIAHVNFDHGVRMQRRANWLNILSQAALVGVMIGADGGPSNPRDPYGTSASPSRRGSLVQGTAATGIVFTELLMRKFSRTFEDEADVEGQRLAAAAGFDPLGASRLWELMIERIPRQNDYGYWRTHPFSDQRQRAATVRARDLSPRSGPSEEPLRRGSQRAILDLLATLRADGDLEENPELPDPPNPIGAPIERTEVEPWRHDLGLFLEMSALEAWPTGAEADALRLARLERLEAREAQRPPLDRELGELIRSIETEIAAVEALGGSPLVATLREKIVALETEQAEQLPRALAVLDEGVFQTPFLRTFLSNYPDSERVAEVALSLGRADARIGRQDSAVEHYLQARRAAPDSAIADQALAGLRALTPELDRLTALRSLEASGDAELERLASTRLTEQAQRFETLENGAAFLRRHPESDQADAVRDRLESLARDLYGEIVLYQGVGDHAQALERIQQILEHAPTTAAAEALRQRAEFDA